jgi:hypothetical protein
MLEGLMISAMYVQVAAFLYRLGNCQRPKASRGPCMPFARDVCWHRITYEYSNWKLIIATERRFRLLIVHNTAVCLYVLSHVLRQFVAPITR